MTAHGGRFTCYRESVATRGDAGTGAMVTDCLCDGKRGIVCAMHAFRASDLDEAAEWLALAASEAPERETARERHFVRVSPTVALEVEGYDGIEVDWRDAASGLVLVSYPALGETRVVSEVSLVPVGLLSTDAEMRRLDGSREHWSSYDWRDRMCETHGEPLPKCPQCVDARKQRSNENLKRARAALAVKRAAKANAAPAMGARDAISRSVRESIGVLPLD